MPASTARSIVWTRSPRRPRSSSWRTASNRWTLGVFVFNPENVFGGRLQDIHLNQGDPQGNAVLATVAVLEDHLRLAVPLLPAFEDCLMQLFLRYFLSELQAPVIFGEGMMNR